MSEQASQDTSGGEPGSALALTIESRKRDIGGFSVRRLLPSGRRRLVGPFIFFDHMGPADFGAGQGIDVRPHPHIGLATVTYLFEGEIIHRDSLGYIQAIRPGAVNWMTAGRGIVHSERTGPDERKQPTRLHGIQSWVALPQAHEETEPAFHHHDADSLPVIEQGGARLRLIAGEALGARSPVETVSPLFYLDAELPKDAAVSLPDEHAERAAYVVEGAVSLGGESVEAGSMMVFAPSAQVTLRANQDSRVMLLGGAPIDGERHIWWNFVSSSQERIEKAKADWKEGRFPKVPGDDESIPLPDA